MLSYKRIVKLRFFYSKFICFFLWKKQNIHRNLRLFHKSYRKLPVISKTSCPKSSFFFMNPFVPGSFRNSETCLNRNLLFFFPPLPSPLPPSSIPYLTIPHCPPLILSQLLVISSQNSNLDRPFLFSYIFFPLITFPSASCWIFLLFISRLPCQFYCLSPNNNVYFEQCSIKVAINPS